MVTSLVELDRAGSLPLCQLLFLLPLFTRQPVGVDVVTVETADIVTPSDLLPLL